MEELIRHREIPILLATYGALLAVAVLELVRERRTLEHSLWRRWVSNVAIGFAGRGLLRWIFPVSALILALRAERLDFGLLHWLDVPLALSVPVSVIALDAISYALHRLNHAVPWLWRLHRVHHTDMDLDFSTSERHHPVETGVNTLLRLVCVPLLGIAPGGIVLYTLFMGPVDALSHGNLRVPGWLDRILRRVFVTPDMHAVHHSARLVETDSNYGNLFSVWDRLFRTYVAAPRDGYDGVRYGLDDFREERDLDLDRLLWQPLRSQAPAVPENEAT